MSRIFNDTLMINYEEFPEEGIKVLTVSRDDEAIHMAYNDEAEALYFKLCGWNDAPVFMTKHLHVPREE